MSKTTHVAATATALHNGEKHDWNVYGVAFHDGDGFDKWVETEVETVNVQLEHGVIPVDIEGLTKDQMETFKEALLLKFDRDERDTLAEAADRRHDEMRDARFHS